MITEEIESPSDHKPAPQHLVLSAMLVWCKNTPLTCRESLRLTRIKTPHIPFRKVLA